MRNERNIELEWSDFYPANCPPAEAELASGTVYRLVQNDLPRAKDFRTLFEERPGWFENKPITIVCKGCGVSVHTDLQDVKRLKNRYKRKFGRCKIAEVELNPTHGVIQHTPSKEKSHHTWWVPVGVEPWVVFNVISS